jgi:hypothetical protein
LGHHVDVGVELVEGLRDDRSVVGDVPVEDLKMSSAQSENSCQSQRGAPSNSQMIGIA